jgi:hypothetical protein
VLLLPGKLEQFELAAHARNLLAIPRVIALEPPRFATSGWLADGLTVRNAKRMRLPGEPKVIVLYHPRQYRLARALHARFEESELWYARPDRDSVRAEDPRRDEELLALDDRAAERATEVLAVTADGDPRFENEPLRARLLELGVISGRAFVPGAQIHYR